MGKQSGRRSGRVWTKASSGRIPDHVQGALRLRLERLAAAQYAGRCREVLVRVRGRYAYVDAYPVKEGHPPGASAEEIDRIESTPIHLFRLGYLGNAERWEFAFYKYGIN